MLFYKPGRKNFSDNFTCRISSTHYLQDQQHNPASSTFILKGLSILVPIEQIPAMMTVCQCFLQPDNKMVAISG